MAGMGLGSAAGAGGAGDALARIIAQRLLERQQAERERAQQVEEAQRSEAMAADAGHRQEQRLMSLAQLRSLDQARQDAAVDRDEERARRNNEFDVNQQREGFEREQATKKEEAQRKFQAEEAEKNRKNTLTIAQLSRAAGGSDREPLIAVMDPTTGKPVLRRRSQAEGMAPASGREQGRAVTSGDAGRVADLDTSLDDLGTLRSSLTETSDATGTMAKVGAMLPNAITEMTGVGVDAKKRQAVIDRVKQVIGKALEGGVLRKEDEIKYEKILPTLGDTPEVAASKLDGLERAIEQRRSVFLDALSSAGFETGQFPKERPKKAEGGGATDSAARAKALMEKYGRSR